MSMNRRTLITSGIALAALPRMSFAATAREITWEDLIPAGVPYSEIIGEGEIDEVNDFWKPIYDENATKFNTALDGTVIKMPGYILPIDQTADGVTGFILVPYVGACIHTPPPPPNQLVFVTTDTPWRTESLWDAIWVSGRMTTTGKSTEVADAGYSITAEAIELYEW